MGGGDVQGILECDLEVVRLSRIGRLFEATLAKIDLSVGQYQEILEIFARDTPTSPLEITENGIGM